jgi:hypothetical protein
LIIDENPQATVTSEAFFVEAWFLHFDAYVHTPPNPPPIWAAAQELQASPFLQPLSSTMELRKLGKDTRIRVHTVQGLTLFVNSDPKPRS